MANVYAKLADLARFGLPPGVLGSFPIGDQEAALVAASSVADDYLSQARDLPLAADSWGLGLTMRVCWIAGYLLLSAKGFNPEGRDKVVVDNYDRAIRWLEMVSQRKLSVVTSADPPPPVSDVSPTVEGPTPLFASAASWRNDGSSSGGRSGF